MSWLYSAYNYWSAIKMKYQLERKTFLDINQNMLHGYILLNSFVSSFFVASLQVLGLYLTAGVKFELNFSITKLDALRLLTPNKYFGNYI
mgnify:CR=1 FL=1